MRIAAWMCVVVAAAGVAACGGGSKYVTVTIPPHLDLAQYQRAALTTFTVENAKGTLHEVATHRFAETVLHAQRDVEVLEVGTVDATLQQVGERTFGPASAKAVGSASDVPVVFAGHLKVSNVKPSGGLAAFTVPHVEANVQVDLAVVLYSTRSGGTLWRASAASSERVASISVSGGIPSFSAKDPNAAYGRLVDQLIASVSQDLYPTFERRRVP